MGMTFGKIWVETPKYELLMKTADYEIRKYLPSVVAEFTYDLSEMTEWAGFRVLTNYIGAFGRAHNTAPKRIAMTAPVITYPPPEKEKDTMEAEKVVMTAPVVTSSQSSDQKTVTMAFVLPSKYTKAADAPKPVDERVVVRDEEGKKYGVVTFAGFATEELVAGKVKGLREVLERDGYKIVGGYKLARYNPPWTLPPFRTMEVMLPVE